MSEWALREKNLKKYPHFDGWISLKEATSYVTNSHSVTTHKFYPFLLFRKRWNRFAKKGSHGKPKERPIRFAARLDAYIFSYYRHILSEAYEKKIFGTSVARSVLAYRRLKDEASGGGKCNIHFARDAFNAIRELGDCHVIALDISSFFENLDHEYLRKIWCGLIGVNRLPDDHYQVFKAITQYSIVDKTEVYERLGYFGVKSSTPTGGPIKGYLKNYKDMPKQLCTGKIFREKIAGGDGNKSLVRKNHKPWGIPQGAPISDLLANIYLIEFDMILAERAKLLGGFYLRYSDDILLILPVDEKSARDFMQQVRDLLPQFGKKLSIKQEKTSLSCFVRAGNEQQYELLSNQKQGRNGLEYLGFRYNGKCIYLRDSTISSLHRKVTRATWHHVIALKRRYPSKSAKELKQLLKIEELVSKFGRVRDFDEMHDDYRNWTFWTYAKKAADIFGLPGTPILRQLRHLRKNIRHRAQMAVDKVSS